MTRNPFTQFKDLHKGRVAALLCTGYSLNYYQKPHPDVIQCGVNTSIFTPHRNDLDYYFIQDSGQTGYTNSYLRRKTEYDAYHPSLEKFYGVSLSKELRASAGSAGAIPFEFSYGTLVKYGGYTTTDHAETPQFCKDIGAENALPATAGSVAFPALQFLLYTGVTTIYLVGCDVTVSDRAGDTIGSNTNNYARQGFLKRWRQFAQWVAQAYPHVRIINVNPIGLCGLFKEELITYPKFRMHVLAPLGTVTSKEFMHCAFTQKVRRFCDMMTKAGHEVYHYGHEESKVNCTEHVPIMSNEAFQKEFGTYDWKNTIFRPSSDKACQQEFDRRAAPALQERVRSKDLVLSWFGKSQQAVTDSIPTGIVIEPSIGYQHTYAPFKVFESYAWMHHIYGKENRHNGRFYDTVIPGFLDPQEFDYKTEKEDFVLYCGRLIACKGVHVAIDACQRTGTHLVIGGQGNLKSLGLDRLPSNVEFVGYLDDESKRDYMGRARALICPTRYIEPFGYVAIEAAMSGTPVISTDWGGFSETVIHGVTGYRCRTMSQFDYALKHCATLSSTTCREWALQNYSIDVARARYLEYFQRVKDAHTGSDFNGRHLSEHPLLELKRPFPGSSLTTNRYGLPHPSPCRHGSQTSNFYQEVYDKYSWYGNAAIDRCPSVRLLPQYREWLKYPALELGCGRGSAVDVFRSEGALVDGIDCVTVHPNMQVGDITLPISGIQNYESIYCIDVIEHIPEIELMGLFRNMQKVSHQAFSIHNGPSVAEAGGLDLHVTRKDWAEWERIISEAFTIHKVIQIHTHQMLYLTSRKTNGETDGLVT